LCAHSSVLVSFAISNKIILCTSVTKLVAYNKTYATSAAMSLATSPLTSYANVAYAIGTFQTAVNDQNTALSMTKPDRHKKGNNVNDAVSLPGQTADYDGIVPSSMTKPDRHRLNSLP
jgi:hypothetical protein